MGRRIKFSFISILAILLIFVIWSFAPKESLQAEKEMLLTKKNGEILPPPSRLSCRDRSGSVELYQHLSACLPPSELEGLTEVCLHSQLAHLLLTSDANTDHLVLACLLDAVRSQGKRAEEFSEFVSRLLPHQAKIYQGRDKWQVLRLRAYAFVTLSETGFPDSAIPMLTDALAYVDERMSAVEFGAAIHVVAALGERGRKFIPYLLTTLGERFAEEEFSLNRYETVFPKEEATTVQIEVIRSLGAVCIRKDKEALAVLQAFANSEEQSTLDSRLTAEAKKALQSIDARRSSAPVFKWLAKNLTTENVADKSSYCTPWLNPKERRYLQNIDIPLLDHDGRKYFLNQLVDRPVLLTFFYTRCQNARKCSATIARLAILQQELIARGMIEDVRLLAVTFEPAFDSPMRIKRYAVDRGLVLGSQALALRLDKERHAAFVEELDTPVAYSSGWVNTHGVEAVLLDTKGRLVRKYKSLAWNEAAVRKDFQRLLMEEYTQ